MAWGSSEQGSRSGFILNGQKSGSGGAGQTTVPSVPTTTPTTSPTPTTQATIPPGTPSVGATTGVPAANSNRGPGQSYGPGFNNFQPQNFEGTPSGYTYGQTGIDTKSLSQYLSDMIYGNTGYGQQALNNMGQNYNQIQGLLGGEHVNRYNAQNQNLNNINNQINGGYGQMQKYMPTADNAYNIAQDNLTDPNGGLGQWSAGMNKDMEKLYAAYDGILNGTVPDETRANIQTIYDNQMAQSRNELNDSYDRSLHQLVDNLGGRGILSGTTSAMANTDLATNLLKQINNAQLSYGTQQANTLLNEPYKIFGAANQLFNSSAQGLNGALGVQNAYNQNFNNALGLAGQANSNYGQQLNGLQLQGQNGQLPLDNILNLVGGLGSNASLANSIYGNTMDPAMNYWNQLNQNEIAMMTSGQGQGGGGSGGEWWWGPAASVATGLINNIF